MRLQSLDRSKVLETPPSRSSSLQLRPRIRRQQGFSKRLAGGHLGFKFHMHCWQKGPHYSTIGLEGPLSFGNSACIYAWMKNPYAR